MELFTNSIKLSINKWGSKYDLLLHNHHAVEWEIRK